MSSVTLIFPHQLFEPHPAVVRSRRIVLVEDSLFFGDPHVGIRFHRQKIVLHRASMKSYRARLEKRGHEVSHLEHEEGTTISDQLEQLRNEGVKEVHLCKPTDFLLEKRLGRAARTFGLRLEMYETPMFLTPASELEEAFSGKRRPLMARFYERQRKRLGILVDDEGNPVGGRWSFDEENRKPMPKRGLEIPEDPSCEPTSAVSEALRYQADRFPDGFGEAETFSYPVTHEGASRWFESFLEERFHRFGPYEDAISGRERVLFHSVLTPMLNIGLLQPEQVLARALEFAREEEVPLNSLEGFVRQILGWREFMLGAYEHLGVACRTGNFWEFEDRPIPAAFYEGSTGIDPVDVVIRRALKTGYCHHIERLMIVGNFMLLCGFHPDRVYQWFMELFVDAYDWVMVPNVYGMSQFADGGRFTTKPYISGSNYVQKMSDFPAGDWCPVWDGLFWRFVKIHEEFFRKQHRLGMMVRQLDRMEAGKLQQHFRAAEGFLDRVSG